jgi:hypothetical protein
VPRDELLLPQATFVDVEAALEGRPPRGVGHRRGTMGAGVGPAGIADHVATRPFLSGLEAPWTDEWRAARPRR